MKHAEAHSPSVSLRSPSICFSTASCSCRRLESGEQRVQGGDIGGGHPAAAPEAGHLHAWIGRHEKRPVVTKKQFHVERAGRAARLGGAEMLDISAIQFAHVACGARQRPIRLVVCRSQVDTGRFASTDRSVAEVAKHPARCTRHAERRVYGAAVTVGAILGNRLPGFVDPRADAKSEGAVVLGKVRASVEILTDVEIIELRRRDQVEAVDRIPANLVGRAGRHRATEFRDGLSRRIDPIDARGLPVMDVEAVEAIHLGPERRAGARRMGGRLQAGDQGVDARLLRGGGLHRHLREQRQRRRIVSRACFSKAFLVGGSVTNSLHHEGADRH